LKSLGFSNPVPHGTGRGCDEPSALNAKIATSKPAAHGLNDPTDAKSILEALISQSFFDFSFLLDGVESSLQTLSTQGLVREASIPG
jgi:hypothetical protein